MRRFVTLAVLLLFTVPFGVSISGCSKAVSVTYCNGTTNSGVQVGQTVTLDLEPRLTGISINQGAISSIGAPSAKDCKGNSSSAAGVVYASQDRTLVDVNPSNGSGGLCAGTWNRQTGGGIPDYTVCTPNGREGVTFITASAQGVTSNPVAVYVHPVVTSIVLGPLSTNCSTDPASNCFASNSQTYYVPPAGGPAAPTPVGAPYTGNSCLSQGAAAQLAARTFKGTDITLPGNNISALVGPITFTAQTPSVVTIDTNGLATATQPGSTIITAAISQSSSTAGSFATCPPASIVLTPAGQTIPPSGTLQLSQNVTQNLVATVKDVNGVQINNLSLTYVSNNPVSIPSSLGSVTPIFPGSAAITAVCQPPNCNTAAFDQIGLFGNGLPVFSEPLPVTAIGTNNSTVLYVASTDSQYILPIDFTVSTPPTPVRLPYPPNSLVLSQDGNSIYMGTANELMVYSTITNSLAAQNTSISGNVLAIAPNGGTLVVSDPVRGLVYLYSTASNTLITQYGGVGTSAQFAPDSSTVYIATTDGRLLAYSTYIGWQAKALPSAASGVAVTVPNAGVYLAENPVDVRTNCPQTTVSGTAPNLITTNNFYPDLGPVAGANAANVPDTPVSVGLVTNNIASTNDGLHELAASPTNFTDILVNKKSGGCTNPPQTATSGLFFTNSVVAAPAFTVAKPTAITAVLPTSDSAYAFVTYTGTGGVVPQYTPATSTLSNIVLQTTAAGAPVAPIAGVVSSDNNTFFVGTSGDDLIHQLKRAAAGFADTATPITPALPSLSKPGASAVPNLIAQKPRKATS